MKSCKILGGEKNTVMQNLKEKIAQEKRPEKKTKVWRRKNS
jgi:hypothetical protein